LDLEIVGYKSSESALNGQICRSLNSSVKQAQIVKPVGVALPTGRHGLTLGRLALPKQSQQITSMDQDGTVKSLIKELFAAENCQ